MSSRRPLPKGKFVTRGGEKLAAILKRTNTGPVEFADRAGVSRVTLHNVITGRRWKYITVDFAIAVRDALPDGSVQVEDFSSVTAKKLSESKTDDEDAPRKKKTGTDG